MENLSHSRQLHTLPKKTCNAAAKSIYDDVFGAPPRFGAPSLSPRVEDYAEIFGSFHSSSRASSIPVLDLPLAVDGDIFFDVRSSHFDYSEVFGGFNDSDFAVSFEELVMADDPCNGLGGSSDEAWSPVEADYLSEESEPSPESEGFFNGKSCDSVVDGNDMKFNISYNKVGRSSSEDIAQFHSVPEYTFVVDKAASLLKLDDDDDYVSMRLSDDGHFNIDLSREMVIERPLKKTMSNPVNGGGKGGMLFGDDVGTCRDYVRTGSFPNETFVTISDVSLKTRPSQVPPPSRPPPALDVKTKDFNKLIPNSKTCTYEGSVGDTSPPYFDVEVDANSSAAVSAAAIKEAMEKAQAKMKSAKELMERKKEGFQSKTKSGLKDNRKDREGNVGRSIDGSGSNDGIETKIGERQYVKRTSLLVLDSLEGEKYQNGSKREETQARDSLSSQGSDKIDGASEWKEATEFFELVRTDKSKNIFDHVINESILAQRTNVIEHGRKEHKENDKKGKSASVQLQEYERKANISKEFSASQVNNGKLEASVAVQRHKELQKKVQRSQEASRQKENEKKVMIDMQLAEAERKQMKADDLQINEKVEVQYKEIKLEVKETMRQRVKEANKRSDDEKRFTREKKGTERRQREALEKLENEKKLNAALEQANNERTLKEDVMEQAEQEKRVKEAYEREENEKKKKKALEREENERRLREALEQEENERRLREAFEKQENERRRKETLEKDQKERRLREALEKEEDEKRRRQNLEKEENEKTLRQSIEKEENERQLRQNLEKEENERRQREAAEPEENEKRQREPFVREENEKRLKEALEKKEKEKRDGHSREKEHDRLKKAFELQGHPKIQVEACEKEEIQKGHRDDFGSVKAECIGKRTEEEIEQEKNKPLREAQVVKEAEEGQKEILYREEFGDTSLEEHKPEDMRKNFQDACNLDESNVKPTQLAGKNEGIYEILEDTEDIYLGELKNIQGGLRSNQKEAVDHNATIDRKKEPSDLCQDNLEHENASEDGSMKKAVEARHSIRPRNFASQKRSALNQGKNYTHGSGENGNKIEQAEVSQTEYTKDNLSSAIAKETFETGKKVEATKPATSEAKGSTLRTAQQVNVSQAAERKMKNCNDTSVGDKETERIKREKELEMERLQKMEEEREREREREKDRMAVDMATLEAHERAYSDARERAERAAIERALAEARQRAMNEARERLEKACAEAREKSLTDKASVEARIRAERAAVERATAEARERAFEKAMAERAASEARERLERSVSDKFSASSRNTGVRLNSLSSDLQDMQMQNSGSFNGSRYQHSSVYGGSYNMERSNGVEGESPQRCKARLERHRRTAERAAKALAEKNMRDLLAQREQAERHRIAETLDAEVRRWSSGKEGNLRALLSTLQYILGPDSGWHPVPLTEVITSAAVKKAYRKATLCVHPDKLQQRGATIHQKYICEKVFDLLKEAWYKFNSEER